MSARRKPSQTARPDQAPATVNPYKSNRGMLRAWKAMAYSFAGFRAAFREESAFRQELALAAVMLPIAALVPVSTAERILLIASVVLVLIIELLNSALEAVVDRISLEKHELSGRAKDYASAAVMLGLLLCGLVWVLILLPLVRTWH